MNDGTTPPTTLLADLDQRQNDVIARLDQLNDQVLKAINDWSQDSVHLDVIA